MKKILFTSLVALVLIGCSKEPQEVSAVHQQPHPVTQQVQQSNSVPTQVPQQTQVAPQQPIVIENKSDSSAVTNMALGMMLGSMMSNSSSGASNQAAYHQIESERRAVEAERRALEAEKRANSYNTKSMASAPSTYLPAQTSTTQYQQVQTPVQQASSAPSIIGSKVAEPVKVQPPQKAEAPKVINAPREIVQTERKPGTFTSGSFTLPKQAKIQEKIVVTETGKSSSNFNKQSSAGFSTNKSVARSSSSFTSSPKRK